jgi:hypothetical protein
MLMLMATFVMCFANSKENCFMNLDRSGLQAQALVLPMSIIHS